MKCPEVEARILDRVVAARPADLPPEVESHVRGCESCRTAWREYRELWEGLGRLPVPDPGAELEAGLDGRLGVVARAMLREGNRRRGFPGYRWVAAIIVAALVGGLSGYAIAASRADDDGRHASVLEISGPTFLLLLRGEAVPRPTTSAEEETLVAEYAGWARQLATRGQLLAAERLSDEMRVLQPTGDGVRISAGAAGAADRVSGFFLIRAPGLEDATRIALASPHVRRGAAIELRRVDTHQ